MHFIIVEKLKLIVGWNPKVACTTLKTLILRKLGHEIIGNVHDNLFLKKFFFFYNVDLNNYTKICVIRNPYERLISGIRQRSKHFGNFEIGDLSKNTINMFLQNLKKYNYIDHHFMPQTENINNFKFDHIIDINEMSKVYSILELEYRNEKLGGHSTKYNDDNNEDNYHNLTMMEIMMLGEYSRNIYSWFSKKDIQLINELYKEDFIFLKENGFDYEIN